MSNQKENAIFGLGLAAAIALGGFALYKSGRPAFAAGGEGGAVMPRAVNSDQYPFATSAEGAGNVADTIARLGTGETPQYNLSAIIPGADIGEIPPMADINDPRSRYNQNRISEVLGWTPEQYQQGYDIIMGERFGGIGPGIPGYQLTAAERYAYDYNDTMAQAEYVVQRNQIIAELGGVWQSGELRIGTSGYSSSTTLSDTARQLMSERYPALYAEAKSPQPTQAEPAPQPAAQPSEASVAPSGQYDPDSAWYGASM